MSYIYVAHLDGKRKPSKIGITSDPAATAWYFKILNKGRIRFDSFKSANSEILNKVRKKFDDKHMGSDWFSVAVQDMKEFIGGIRGVTTIGKTETKVSFAVIDKEIQRKTKKLLLCFFEFYDSYLIIPGSDKHKLTTIVSRNNPGAFTLYTTIFYDSDQKDLEALMKLCFSTYHIRDNWFKKIPDSVIIPFLQEHQKNCTKIPRQPDQDVAGPVIPKTNTDKKENMFDLDPPKKKSAKKKSMKKKQSPSKKSTKKKPKTS
jgi:hypothetical protein